MKLFRVILFIAIFCFLLFCSCFADYALRVHFLSLGSGECTLIQFGNEAIMVDSGGLLGGYKLMDYLEQEKIKSIKYLIFSHYHPDHIGGAFFLLPKFKVEVVCDNGAHLDLSDHIECWYNELVRSKKNYLQLKKGDSINFYGIRINVLWPEDQIDSSNNSSIVLKLTCGKLSIFLPGDLMITGEKHLLKEGKNLKADILKVGHHGRKNATSEAFLERVSPKIAIISPTYKNKDTLFETINLLKKRKIKVLRTDSDGNVVIEVDKDGNYKIESVQK